MTFNLSFDLASDIQLDLQERARSAGARLRAVSDAKPGGLTSDAVKASNEYQLAKAQYDAAFNELRRFNGQFVKVFKKELREQRRAR